VEFSDGLRRIDRASEVAFLAMDLRYRGRVDFAEGFLDAYANRVDDHDLFGVVDFFAAYRALVRAKVAALAAGQSTIAAPQRAQARLSVDHHLDLAESLLEVRANPELVLICGTVGSGKSSVARQLARSGHGISITSDRVRKILAGLPVASHRKTAPDQGLYRPDRKDDVYRALLERAEPVLESGRNAILDASFSRRRWRTQARAWAKERGIRIRLVEVRCDPEVALSRLRERERLGADPSDAGPDFLPVSRERFEPPDEWPENERLVIRSDEDGWRDRIAPARRPARTGSSTA
jgi:predicted kinase